MSRQSDWTFELFGDATGNCRRAAIALEELGIPYTVRKLSLRRGDHLTPEYLARNPDGKVPTLLIRREGSEPTYLTQSNAIMLFLDDLSPGRLLPKDPLPRAAALETYMYLLTEVIALVTVVRQLRMARVVDMAERLEHEAGQRFLGAAHYLERAQYFNGAEFGLADIVGLTVAHGLLRVLDWSGQMRLSKWFDAGIQRPSFIKGSAIFD